MVKQSPYSVSERRDHRFRDGKIPLKVVSFNKADITVDDFIRMIEKEFPNTAKDKLKIYQHPYIDKICVAEMVFLP